jgi:hypothetical protein
MITWISLPSPGSSKYKNYRMKKKAFVLNMIDMALRDFKVRQAQTS